MMDRRIINETLEKMSSRGYKFVLYGKKAEKKILLYKDGKAMVLYSGYFERGQKYRSMQGSFKLAEKINKSFKKKKIMAQVTPALMLPFILDKTKQ